MSHTVGTLGLTMVEMTEGIRNSIVCLQHDLIDIRVFQRCYPDRHTSGCGELLDKTERDFCLHTLSFIVSGVNIIHVYHRPNNHNYVSVTMDNGVSAFCVPAFC